MAAAAAAVPFDEAMANLPQQTQEEQTQQHPGHQLFESVVEDDYERLVKLFAAHARNSLVSYMSMKSRWARQRQDSMAKSGTQRYITVQSHKFTFAYMLNCTVCKTSLRYWLKVQQRVL